MEGIFVSNANFYALRMMGEHIWKPKFFVDYLMMVIIV